MFNCLHRASSVLLPTSPPPQLPFLDGKMFLHRERSLDTITHLSIQALPAKQTPYSSVSLFHRVSGFPRRSPAPVEAVNPEGFEEPNHYSPGPAGGGALRLRSSLKILGSSFPASAGAGSDLLTKNRFCSRPSPARGGGRQRDHVTFGSMR